MARGDGIRLLLQAQNRSERQDGGILPEALALAGMIAGAAPSVGTGTQGQTTSPSQVAATSQAPAGAPPRYLTDQTGVADAYSDGIPPPTAGPSIREELHDAFRAPDASPESIKDILFEWLQPFKGDAPISSEFNPERVHPVHGDVRPHRGIDFDLPLGTPVLSMGPGTVGEVSYQPEGAGNYISVDHPGGVTSRYFHLQDLPQFAPGATIHAGQQIGAVGNTGVSTGPHLQLETLRDGVHVNPRDVLPWLGQRYPL